MTDDSTGANRMFEGATGAEIAYVAAIFEGEGSICARKRAGGTTYQGKLDIGMTDLDVLEHVQSIVGGKLYGPYMNKPAQTKPNYVWSLFSWDDIEGFYEVVKPWLKSRRRGQFEDALAKAPPRGQRHVGAWNAAKTHCKYGHEFTPENTYIDPKTGARSCVTCNLRRGRESKRREREGFVITHEPSHKRWHANKGIIHPSCIFCGTAFGAASPPQDYSAIAEANRNRVWTDEQRAAKSAQMHERYGTEPQPPKVVTSKAMHDRWHVGRDLVSPCCIYCGTAEGEPYVRPPLSVESRAQISDSLKRYNEELRAEA